MVHLEEEKISKGLKKAKDSNVNKSEKNQDSVHNSQFPVFKISPKGSIIYANKACSPVLRKWNCYASNTIPKQILEKFPALTDLNSDVTITITTEVQTFYLSVVGFEDAGFIGVYGFKTEMASNLHQSN